MTLREEVRADLADLSVDAVVPPLRSGSFPEWVDIDDVVALGARSAIAILRLADRRALVLPLVHEGRWRRAEAADAMSMDVLLARPPLELRLIHPAPSCSDRHERTLDVDMTNDVRVVDDLIVAKWQLLAEPGSMAGPRTMAHLAEAGFTAMPDPIAILSWRDQLIASLTRYLPEARDGWDWMLDDVRLMLLDAEPPPDWPDRLGRLTGRLHAAAARPTTVIPAPVTRSDLAPLARHYRGLLGSVLDDELMEALVPWRGALQHACDVVASATDVEVLPLHGDLHPGQFLRWRDGIAVSDFDGNPLLVSSDRSLPGPTAHDVATMLRGFDHVAIAAARRVDDPSALSRARAWARQARADALAAYRDVDGVPELNLELLHALEALSPLHEAAYASAYLPRWRYVPLAVLRDRR